MENLVANRCALGEPLGRGAWLWAAPAAGAVVAWLLVFVVFVFNRLGAYACFYACVPLRKRVAQASYVNESAPIQVHIDPSLRKQCHTGGNMAAMGIQPFATIAESVLWGGAGEGCADLECSECSSCDPDCDEDEPCPTIIFCGCCTCFGPLATLHRIYRELCTCELQLLPQHAKCRSYAWHAPPLSSHSMDPAWAHDSCDAPWMQWTAAAASGTVCAAAQCLFHPRAWMIRLCVAASALCAAVPIYAAVSGYTMAAAAPPPATGVANGTHAGPRSNATAPSPWDSARVHNGEVALWLLCGAAAAAIVCVVLAVSCPASYVTHRYSRSTMRSTWHEHGELCARRSLCEVCGAPLLCAVLSTVCFAPVGLLLFGAIYIATKGGIPAGVALLPVWLALVVLDGAALIGSVVAVYKFFAVTDRELRIWVMAPLAVLVLLLISALPTGGLIYLCLSLSEGAGSPPSWPALIPIAIAAALAVVLCATAGCCFFCSDATEEARDRAAGFMTDVEKEYDAWAAEERMLRAAVRAAATADSAEEASDVENE